MALSLASFLERFEEFTDTPTAMVSRALASAELRTPCDVWGGLQEEGVGWLAAHILATLPSSRDMRLVAKDGSTLYHGERKRLEYIVATSIRAAGIPAGLEACNDEACDDVAAGSVATGRVVMVEVEADFPAAVAGVITLEENIHYQIVENVVLTAGNHIVMANGATIGGYSLDVDTLTGNVSGGCLISIESAIDSRFVDVGLVNTSTDAGSSAVCQSAAASLTTFDRCSLTGRADILASAGLATVLRSCILVSSGLFGIEVSGALNNLLVRDCSMVLSATGAEGIRFDATAVIDGIVTVETTRFVFLGASQVGLDQDAGASIKDGLLFRNIFSGAGTNVQGFSHSSPEWQFDRNDGGAMIDSAAAGGTYNSNGVINTTVSSQNTYYPISDGATAAYELQAFTERFELADALTGMIRYTGKETRHVTIQGLVSIARQGGGTPEFAVGVYLNGVLMPASVGQVETNAQYRPAMSSPVIAEIETGDEIELRIANLDNTADANTSTATLSIVSSR